MITDQHQKGKTMGYHEDNTTHHRESKDNCQREKKSERKQRPIAPPAGAIRITRARD
jgi:hypothetical protein